jgi:hypothetical protein
MLPPVYPPPSARTDVLSPSDITQLSRCTPAMGVRVFEPPELDAHADRLIAALSPALPPKPTQDYFELHAAIIEYVTHLRNEEMPPERVVIMVKEAIARARRSDAERSGHRLKELVVTASIKAYFAL